MNRNNKVKILPSLEVPGLYKIINIRILHHELNNYVDSLAININLKDLLDWKLLIRVTYRNTNKIGIFKRIRRFPSDKECEISISIPIPDQEQVIYGINKESLGFYNPINESKFYSFISQYEQYDNLKSYMIYSAQFAIHSIFEQGFRCNGIKIQLSNT